MFGLELLEKLIAVVIVILGLALFVQSLQAVVKKVFKLKSLQIEQSLVHLFHYVLDDTAALDSLAQKQWNSPLLRHVLPRTRHPAEADAKVKALFNAVTKEFKQIGRVTWRGKLMLDSVAKEDLTKFLSKVPANEMLVSLFPETRGLLAKVGAQLAALRAAAELLRGEGKKLLNADELAPVEKLVADVGAIFGETGINSRLVVSDILNLKQVDPAALLASVAEAQAKLSQAASRAENDPNSAAAARTLRDAATRLDTIADAVRGLERGVASLRGVVDRVEVWYDTVMQSFDERYARSMRTTTIILSAFVVILLNANVVTIYRDISSNDAKRAIIMRYGEGLRRPADAQSGGDQSGGQTGGGQAGGQNNAAGGGETPVTPEQLYKEGRDLIEKNVTDFTSLGLSGPAWIKGVPDWFRGTGYYAHPERSSLQFRLGQAVYALFGWLLMILLLSAGAPFWQDTLETLFGFKNLLRKRSGTRNTEQESGEGQQKP